MAPRPRPKPGAAKAEEKPEQPPQEKPAERTAAATTATMGTADKGSRAKAEAAHERANDEVQRGLKNPALPAAGWPVNANGTPLIPAEMAAAELIPTGQYANVSVGPARIHFLIDPDRVLGEGESYFTPEQRETISKAMNEAAELVEVDVIAVQRNLTLESIQEQSSAPASS